MAVIGAIQEQQHNDNSVLFVRIDDMTDASQMQHAKRFKRYPCPSGAWGPAGAN